MNANTDYRADEEGFPRLSNIGLTGVLVSFADQLSEAANRAALAFRAMIEAESWPGVEETATSLTSVYVGFDPKQAPHAAITAAIRAALEGKDWYGAPLPEKRALWRIPTAFGGKWAPQLEEAAALAGVPPAEAISEITQQTVRVMTIGFAPGQPYLGQLPLNWDIPRQSALTAKVPVGALVVAIRQLVLFTAETPTGWRHIGQTVFRGFRPETPDPFVLRPGDEVVFEQVTDTVLENIRAQDSSGNGGAVREDIR